MATEAPTWTWVGQARATGAGDVAPQTQAGPGEPFS